MSGADESPEFNPFDAAMRGRDLALSIAGGGDEESQEHFEAAAELVEWVVRAQSDTAALRGRVRELELELALARSQPALALSAAVPSPATSNGAAAKEQHERVMACLRKRRERERKKTRDKAVTVTRDQSVTGVTVTNSPPDLDQDPEKDLDPKLFSSSALPQQMQIKEGEGNARDGHAVTRVTERDRDGVTEDQETAETEYWLRLWDIWDTLNGGDLGRDQAEPHRKRLHSAWLFCERRGSARGLPATAIFSEAAVRFLAEPKTRQKALGLEVLCAQLAALTSAAQLSGTALADSERRDALIRKLKTDLETVQTGMNVVDAVEKVQLEKKKARLEQQLSDMGVAS